MPQFIMVFFLEIYQLSFWFFNNLLLWRNLLLEFSLKVIFRRWMFIIYGMHYILDGSWWKLSLFIMLLFLELYKFFFLFLKVWSDGEILAWDLVSKWYSEDGCSEVIVITSFSIFSYENMFYSMCCFSLNSINSSSCFYKLWSYLSNMAWCLL